MDLDIFNYEINDFVGPLDLLLHLIEKNKIDIYDIPIATLTDEYMAYIENNNKKDMETLSEFILMSATLISIKSKMLMPKKNNEDDLEAEDPRTDLVNSLIEYKKIKDVVEILKTDYDGKIFTKLEKEELNSILDVSNTQQIEIDEILKDLTLQKLYFVFKDVIDRNEKIEVKVKKSFSYVKQEEFKVSDKIQFISDYVKTKKNVDFIDLFKNDASRNEKVTTFLALLELIKLKIIFCEQVDNFSKITIKYNYERRDLNE